MRTFLPRTIVSALLALACLAGAARAQEPVRLLAAASTTEAVEATAQAFEAETGTKVVPIIASTAQLARMVEGGIQADLFLSADERWMTHLVGQGLIEAETVRPLLANRLVLIAPADRPFTIDLKQGAELHAALGEGRLALADTAGVPAGRYALEALRTLGLWDQVKDRTLLGADVRAALAWVEADVAAAAVVYRSDALNRSKVVIAGLFPEDSHAPIRYPLGLIGSDPSPQARAYWRFLQSAEAGEIFSAYGFIPLGPGGAAP